MAEEALPNDISLLVSRHLSSIDHVSVVIALAANNGIATGATTLAGAAALGEATTAAVLRDLVASGLVTESEAGFRISSEDPESGASINLAAVYNQIPIAVIRAIYDRPVSPAKSFAEAFRIRRTTE
jgi:hypothetical protein